MQTYLNIQWRENNSSYLLEHIISIKQGISLISATCQPWCIPTHVWMLLSQWIQEHSWQRLKVARVAKYETFLTCIALVTELFWWIPRIYFVINDCIWWIIPFLLRESHYNYKLRHVAILYSLATLWLVNNQGLVIRPRRTASYIVENNNAILIILMMKANYFHYYLIIDMVSVVVVVAVELVILVVLMNILSLSLI